MRDLILQALRESVKAYPELKAYLTDNALKLLKQLEDEPEGWREKFEPYSGDRPYVFNMDDWKITEDDIKKAVKIWDKLMPEYEGLLDAEVEVNDA